MREAHRYAIPALMLIVILAPPPRTNASAPHPPGRAAAVSPGMQAGYTYYDQQHPGTQGHQVATQAGSGRVHLVWTLGEPPQGIHEVFYNSWATLTSTWLVPYGCQISPIGGDPRPSYGAYPNVDVAYDRNPIPGFSAQFYPYPFFSFVLRGIRPDLCVFAYAYLNVSQLLEPIFPKLDVDQDSPPRRAVKSAQGTDMIHVAGCDTMTSGSGINYFVYWRFDGTSWSNPVLMDSSYTVSQLAVADPTTDEVAYVFCRPINSASPSPIDNDIAFYKSSDNGLPWVTSGTGGPAALTNVTNYTVAQNGRAYTDLSAIYDFNGVLHIVWNERRFIPPDSHFVGECELVHWDDASTTKRPIARAFWDNPAANGQYSMNLCKVTMGVANGWTTCGGQPNNNYLYVTYTRFGGPTAPELADHSAAGYMNGETYLSISNDGGQTWSPPRNLTNTKTPNCNPATGDSCASEHWATIAKTVDDTIHISYILDRDAGAAPLGQGAWTYNPVMYYRIPGGTDGALCPEIAPVLEYLLTDTTAAASHKTAATTVAKNLTVDNYGNATLTGNVSAVYTNPPTPPVNWLTVGGAQTQGYSIVAGTPAVKWIVLASNAGLDTGVTYQAELRISHNDPHKASPVVLPFQITGPACACPAQGDVKPDGVPDVFDIVYLIDYAFSGGTQPPKDPPCPHVDRGDVNCDGVDDVFDVVGLIDYVFSGGEPPCNPCACSPYPTNCPE
jgi:hypothetical protein